MKKKMPHPEFLKHKSHKSAQKCVFCILLCPFVTFVFQKFETTYVLCFCYLSMIRFRILLKDSGVTPR